LIVAVIGLVAAPFIWIWIYRRTKRTLADNIDVILIGTSGMSAAEEVFLGSVANYVIHHAHCPVFAIR